MSHPDMLVHRFFLDVRSQDEVLRHTVDTNNEWSPEGGWCIDFVKNLTLEEGIWLTQNAIIKPIGFTRESVADIQTAADSVNGVFQVPEEENVVYNKQRSNHWIHATNPATPNSLINGQLIKHPLPRGRGLNGHLEWYGVYNSENCTIIREGVAYSNLNKFSLAHLAADRPDRITSRNAWNYCSREVDGIWVSMSDLKAH